MYKACILPLAAGAFLLLHGCGTVEDAKFSKRATSLASAKSDSDHCWKIAQKTNITDTDATVDMAAGWVFFGVAGAVVAASATEEARKNPKNYRRREVHEKCMTERGYKKIE